MTRHRPQCGAEWVRTRICVQTRTSRAEYSYGRLVSGMFAGFSFLALAPAATGLFSVVSYSVAQRTNDCGIRMALGATGLEVLRLVFRSTSGSVIGGLAGGMALSLALSKFLSRWAEGSSQSPLLFMVATLLLVLTAAFAALLPARRASSIDPMEALR